MPPGFDWCLAFDIQFVTTRPTDNSPFVTTLFNAAVFNPGNQLSLGGISDRVGWRELAGTLYGLATAELRKGDLTASQATYVRALKLAEHVLELDSDNLPRQLKVALFKARTQDFEGAQKLVEPLNVPGLEAGTLYNIACIFAQLTSPDNKTAKPGADRAAAVKSIKSRALSRRISHTERTYAQRPRIDGARKLQSRQYQLCDRFGANYGWPA